MQKRRRAFLLRPQSFYFLNSIIVSFEKSTYCVLVHFPLFASVITIVTCAFPLYGIFVLKSSLSNLSLVEKTSLLPMLIEIFASLFFAVESVVLVVFPPSTVSL